MPLSACPAHLTWSFRQRVAKTCRASAMKSGLELILRALAGSNSIRVSVDPDPCPEGL